MEIIKSFFKAIPSRPDYFYFNYVEEDVEVNFTNYSLIYSIFRYYLYFYLEDITVFDT